MGRKNLFAFTFWRDFWVENKANIMQGSEVPEVQTEENLQPTP